MKLKHLYIISFLFILVWGCSDLKTDIAEPEEVSFHKAGILDPASHEWHGDLIKNNNWNMQECQKCHSAKYSGGTTGSSCLNCHTSSKGPEACNTCHGTFNGSNRIAPPRDLNGNTSTSLLSVGAHTSHLYENSIGNTIRCSSCHKFPQSVYAEGHIDNTPGAEIVFGNLAVNTVYNSSTGTCANSYCHGNFEFKKSDAAPENQFAYISDKMIGSNKTVKWNKVDGTEAKCGSCHGLPPEGHIKVPMNACVSCHPTVVDEAGNIIDKTKHINGVVNVRLNK